METLGDRDLQLKWEETIMKLKEYLKSLLLKKHKKIDKISEITDDKIAETLQKEEEDDTDSGKDGKENQTEKPGGNLGEDEKKSDFDVPQEDQDEYIPQDSEFGEALGEQSRFAEVYPPFLGYYSQGKKSYFDRNTNLWSKKKQLKPFNHKLPEGIKKYTYTGVIIAGTNAIPLPEGAWPDTNSLCTQGYTPEFQVDQNGCVYLISTQKQFISFNFGLDQHKADTPPIKEDNDRIIFDSLSSRTQELLSKLRASGLSAKEMAETIKYYIIKSKKYSTKVQGTLHKKSNRNNYIKHLDESPILECFSANSLCVALCRELGIPARLVVGHMVQSTNKEGKACLTKNDGHAWSEIWDDTVGMWIRVDATPTQKEDGEDSNQNGQEQNENQNNNQNADNNFGDNQNQESGNEGQQGKQGDKSNNQDQQGNKSDNKDQQGNKSDNKNQQGNSGDSKDSDGDQDSDSQSDSQQESQNQPTQNNKGKLRDTSGNQQQKSPEELLDEMMEKAKEDSLVKQSKQLQETLDKLEKAETKEDIKDILDKSGLSDFAKDMVDKLGEDRILEEEKKEIESLDDEKKIDEALKDSLLDEENKRKLREYANMIKKKIEDEKRRMKSEMERLGFDEHELAYYKEYKELEAEVEPEVRKQIRELQKILPAQYQIVKDDSQMYRSGPQIDGAKLTEFMVTGDPLVFKRSKEVRESNEINMFETIIIDTSGSMGYFSTHGSILRESIKAAIIRAKVLEHFKVDFSIVLFGDRVDEVMSFGEKFSSKGKCSIPAKLMRAAHVSGGNSREPISYVYQNMLKQFKKNRGKSFGNISFIGDGDLYQGCEVPQLKAMIEDLKHRGFGVTAYYINQRRSDLIAYYFGTPEDGGAVYAGDSKDLANKIIESHRTHLKKKIKKYTK